MVLRRFCGYFCNQPCHVLSEINVKKYESVLVGKRSASTHDLSGTYVLWSTSEHSQLQKMITKCSFKLASL